MSNPLATIVFAKLLQERVVLATNKATTTELMIVLEELIVKLKTKMNSPLICKMSYNHLTKR